LTRIEQADRVSPLKDIFIRFKVSLSSGTEKISVRLLLWTFIVLVYFFTANFTLSGPNPSTRYVLTKTIVENSHSWFPMDWQFWFPEEWLDSFWVSPDYAQIGDQFYCDKAPGLSLLLIPVYILASWIAPFLMVDTGNPVFTSTDTLAIEMMQLVLLVINAWGIVRVYDIATEMGVRSKKALITSLIVGFGTIFWSFSPTLFPHALIATLLLEVTWRLVQARNNKHSFRNVLVAGLLLGYGGVIEYPVVFIVPLSCLYLLVPFTKMKLFKLQDLKEQGLASFIQLLKEDTIVKRFTACFVLGSVSVIAFLPFFLYNMTAFGGITELAYSFSHWYDNIHFYNPLQSGLDTLIISSFRGLLTFSPVILLSVWGLIIMYRKWPGESLFMITVAVFFVFFYAKNFDPTGGASFGPRYIIPSIPFLILPLAFLMEEWADNALFSLSFRVLAGLSVFYNFLGLWASRAGPLIFDGSVHPVLDICWDQFQLFLEGDYRFFRPAIWHENILAAVIIIAIIAVLMLVMIMVLISARSESVTGEKENLTVNQLPERITALQRAEINAWFSIFVFALIVAFQTLIAPAMSRGYDTHLALLLEAGSDVSGYILPPSSIWALPALDLIFIIILGLLVLVSSINLAESIWKSQKKTS